MTYTERFGTGTIQSTQVSYLALNPTGDVVLDWPKETAPSPNLLATIIDVDSGNLPVTVTLPDATQGSTGAELLLNNVGNAVVTVVDNQGGAVLTLVVAIGQAWVIYLCDNTTAAGRWRTFQLGSFTSQVQAASLAGSGLVAIGNTLNGDAPSFSFSATPTTLSLTDRAKIFRWTGGVGVLNLPSSGVVPVGWYVGLRNDGSGALTVTPSGGDVVNGSATLVLQPGDSCWVVCMAAGIMDTVGLGKASTVAFDYTTIAVPGTGAYTLSGAELNRITYKFTGLLTGDRTIIVPATVQQYWVTNATTGAFNFYVKTLAQAAPGVQVAQNQALILYSDSNNVVNADTASGGVSVPVPINQGGTAATTASGARTNLGSTAVGDAVFIAASAAAARSALDAASLTQTNAFSGVPSSLTSASLGDFFVYQSTDAGAAVGPDVVIDRFSATPAANDLLGRLLFRGRSSTAVARTYADAYAKLITVTNAAEDGELYLQTIAAGALADKLVIGKGGVYTPGAAGGDKGLNTLNATQLFEAGVALASKYLAIALLTTNGDLITRVAGVPARLGIGVNGTVLTVAAGALSWAASSSVTQNTYDSGDQTITAGGSLSLTHGLGATPTGLLTLLHCTSSDNGYNTGDFIVIPPNTNGGSGNNQGFNARITATQVIIRYGSNGSGVFRVLDGSTGVSVNLTDASWRLVVRAQRVF